MGSMFFKRNSSTILTCLGAVGVIATTILAVKATPKAVKALEQAKEEKGEELTKVEKVKVAAPAYVPTAAVGVSTIACIFGANVLNKRQQASLMGAYALLNTSYKEYKKKTNEVFGDNADRRIEEAIATSKKVFETVEKGKELFFDNFSMRFFSSTREKVYKAEVLINELLETRGMALLSEYYAAIGLPCSPGDYELGWSRSSGFAYGYDSIQFEYEKSNEFTCIVMMTEPTPDYYLY